MTDDNGSVTVQVIFETHSVTVDNEHRIATGWLDGQVSDAGKRLARQLGERHRTAHIDAVFTSDLGRAVETAQIAFGGSALSIHADPRLRESNYGALNGAPVEVIDNQRRRRIEEPFPDGESYRQVVARVQDFLSDLAREWNGARVVVIGHSATRWALEHLLVGSALEDLVTAPFEWQEGWLYTVP